MQPFEELEAHLALQDPAAAAAVSPPEDLGDASTARRASASSASAARTSPRPCALSATWVKLAAITSSQAAIALTRFSLFT